MAFKDPRDELLRKFSKNVRRAMESRENLTPSRSVKFNPETMETSIGGTITPGKIRRNPDDSSILSVSSNSSNNSNNGPFHPPSAPADKKVRTEPEQTSISRRKSEQNSAPSFKSKLPITPVGQKLRRHTMDKMAANATPECFKPVAFETPASTRGKHRRSSSLEKGGADADEDTAITVAVRVRPFSSREIAEGDTKCIVSMIDNETIMTAENGTVSRFTYDYSFWSFDKTGGQYAGQEYVYETLAQPMLGRVFEGYNVCLFAYGQTGSGKSYSITGHAEEIGIIPRFCEELFSRINSSNEEQEVKINSEISFFEIYNEKIHDLLTPISKDKLGKKPNLKVREHPLLGPFVEGLSSYVVKSFDDVEGWLSVGNKHRATAATGMNDKSSRSHSVFTLVVTQTRTDNIEGEDHEHSITSKINLVDLAGSERQSQAKTSGDRLREGSSINKSLMTLGKVISLLSEQANSTSKKKKVFIPYRDSVLTWMLKESLGGNSKTAMLATISPSSIHMDESLSTLRYAKQARSIINLARVNEDPKARLIRELRAEIEKLRNVTGLDSSDDVIGASLAEIANLRDKLSKKEKEMDEMTRSWQERLTRSEQRKMEEARSLEKSGISFQVDNRLPNLVNLNEDPQLSEMLLYILKEGQTKVGRMHEHSKHDIQLNGPLIAEDHCIINYVDGDLVSIMPLGDAQTYVNGNLISDPTILHHGDRVILGGDHYFRFNHPQEVQKAHKDRKSIGANQGPIKDFEFARQELIQVQNARHQAELDEAKQKHHTELQRTQTEAQQQADKLLEEQRTWYEDRMSELEKRYKDRVSELEQRVTTFKDQKQTTDGDWQKAQDMIQALEKEKLMLGLEVNANRKRLEMEAKAAEQAVEKSRGHHMQIFEMLEKEKEKIKKDVEQMQQMRQRRGVMTPKLTPARTPLSDTAIRDLYRIPLLLREANKIAQFLKKEVFFMRHDVKDDKDTETLVKITNKKLGICTFWSMEKFESRLVQMRELYNQGDPDCGSEEDEIFNDTTDTWECEARIHCDQYATPQLIKSKNRRTSIANTAKRLSFESSSPMTPCAKKRLKSENNTPTIGEEEVFEDTPNGSSSDSIPVVGICQDLISLSVDRFNGSAFEESIVDKILCQCELLRTGVVNIVDSYKRAISLGTSKEYAQSHMLQVNAVQMTSSVQMLLALSSLWSSSYTRFTSGLVHDLCVTITSCVRKLSKQLLLLLQGCENDVESLITTYSSRFLELLQSLTKHCGELSLATDTPMLVLQDRPESAASDEEDDFVNPLAQIKLSDELRQSFLGGCDLFVDKTLQGGVKTIEDCEIQLQDLHDQTPPDKLCEEVSREVEVVIASCKILLQKCQQVQVELDSTLSELGKKEPACENFYDRSYQRSLALISHISNLTDATSLLTQASHNFYKGQDESSLRKVHRCADMIQKSTSKLLATSNTDTHTTNSNGDSQSDSSLEVSVLSDGQSEILEIASQDVKSATSTLIALLRKRVGEEKLFSPTKPKRMLPVSPENSNKASAQDSIRRRSISRTLSLIDRENKR